MAYAAAMDSAANIDLELDVVGLTHPGRRAKELSAEVVRPLRAADLAMLAGSREIAPIPLKRLSSRHHGLARILAGGTAPGEAGIIMGYNPTTVSILRGDPAFCELESFYREQGDEYFFDRHEQIAGIGREAASQLEERLEEKPETFSNKALSDLMVVALDRTGMGPSSKSDITVTHDLGERVEAARKRALEARMIEAIDITPEVINGTTSAQSGSAFQADSGNSKDADEA